MRCIVPIAICLAAAASAPLLAQQSSSYRLDEHAFNQGGRPADGVTATSASFRISLDSIGEAAADTGLASPSYRMDGAFTSAYPPPGEVSGLRFADPTTLTWNPERSVGSYQVYRDALGSLSSSQYGMCWQQNVTGESVNDTDPINPGSGFFYLVTASNRLDERGTKGSDSTGSERAGSACP